nr:hypothetical protein [Tanacetum cinerariifolium]
MLPEESDHVEKYTGGLLDLIQGNVMSARLKAMQEAIELAIMDQKVLDCLILGSVDSYGHLIVSKLDSDSKGDDSIIEKTTSDEDAQRRHL